MSGPERIDRLMNAHAIMGVAEQAETPHVSAVDAEADAAASRAALAQRRAEWRAMVPARFRDATLADHAEWTGHGDLAAWSTDDKPPNLLLFGPVGVGKSHAATAAVRPHVGAGAELVWTPVGEMLDRLDWRRPDSHDWLTRLMTVDLLVVDDIGTERANEWTAERLYAVVNRRWLDRLPIVATSNIDPTDLADVLGPRTYSRLVGGAMTLVMAGNDRRRDAAAR